jgi:hypothetical protein
MSILRNPPKKWPRQARRAFERFADKPPRPTESIGANRRLRRAHGLSVAALATLLFSAQLQAFHDAEDAAHTVTTLARGYDSTLLQTDRDASANQLLAMSAFALKFLHKGQAAVGITYDTTIGNSVDVDGIAALNLRAGGTVGADVASGAPSTAAGVSYNAGTRTLTNTTTPSGTLATWSGILTIGQTYVIEIAANIATTCGLSLQDGAGNTQVVLNANIGGFPWKGLCYVSFTATATTAAIVAINDAFQGTIRIAKIAPLTGSLPAKRFWVKPGTGSDSIDGIDAQNVATPLNSVAEALKFLTTGNGDQIMVAEGTTMTTLPSFAGRSGFSAAYPTVVQTFDPADASNAAKYGRAYQRGAWAKVTDPNNSWTSTGILNYFALRGFEFGNGNLNDQGMGFLAPSANQYNYLLIEANRFMYCSLAYDGDMHGTTDKSTWALGHIYRNNVFYGAWTTDSTFQGPSNLFVGFVNGTYEDNINCHAGWKVGASRDDTLANGGNGALANRKHPVYFYAESNITSRRNFHADGSGDGGSWRGDTYLYDSVIMDCPTALMVFGGDSQDVKRPDGRMVKCRGNAAIGSASLNTASGGIGNGIGMDNSNVNSEMWDNLIARGDLSNSNAFSFTIQASYNQPSYGSIHDNVAYSWTNSGSSYFLGGGFFPAQVFGTYSNNWSDDPTGSPSGVGNINKSARTYPNPYANSDALAAASGISGVTDKATLITKLIAEPVAHHQRTVLTTLRTGYGMTTTIQ